MGPILNLIIMINFMFLSINAFIMLCIRQYSNARVLIRIVREVRVRSWCTRQTKNRMNFVKLSGPFSFQNTMWSSIMTSIEFSTLYNPPTYRRHPNVYSRNIRRACPTSGNVSTYIKMLNISIKRITRISTYHRLPSYHRLPIRRRSRVSVNVSL